MSIDPHPHYEVVIGLEVHTHLRTASKLFSTAPVRYGDPPNHNVSPVCLALPGALPVLNARAVDFAIRAALATHCTVHRSSIFARKNYFYPDLPKGYQISQYEEPIATGGWLDIELDSAAGGCKRIAITRIHMEEDAGKSIHDDAHAGRDGTLVDLNRAGVPLLEIVSEPDMRSPTEAGAYLRTLRSILRYIEVSDADMEKGHFRCDANVSLRPKGQEQLGTRTESENLNSFRFVEDALRAEITRQAKVLDEGGEIAQATMLFDASTGRTRVMRVKESADDYRYFPDPDLVPLVLAEDQVERVRRTLPELPDRKRVRFQEEYDLSESDAQRLTATRPLADFFEAATRAHGQPRVVANWMLRDVLQALKERDVDALALTPGALAALIRLVEEGKVTAQTAREIFPELAERGGDPATLVRDRGLEAVSDDGALDACVDEVLAAHPDAVERVRTGDEKVLNFLMGQVMKRTRGKASPDGVRKILMARLGS